MAHFFEKVSYLLEAENKTQKDDGGLLKGGIYAVKVQPAPLRMLFIRRAVLENLARDIQCIVITPIPAQKFISNMDDESVQLFIEGINSGRLKLISPIGDYKKNIFRFGPKRFLDEVEQFSVQGKSLIILDQAEMLFTVDDGEILKFQVQAYVDWMMRSGNAGLFLLPDSTDFDNGGTCFQPLSSYFNGIASFYMLRSKLEIGVDFWTTQSGIVLSRPLPVSTTAGGLINLQLSLAMDRRNRCRLTKADTEDMPKFDAEESVDRTRQADHCEERSDSIRMTVLPREEYRPAAAPIQAYPAPASIPVRPPDAKGVRTRQRWHSWAGRIVLFATTALAFGALAMSVERSNPGLVSSGVRPLFNVLAKLNMQNNAVAASTARPLPGLPDKIAIEAGLQKTSVAPPLATTTLDVPGTIDAKPVEARPSIDAEQKAMKEQAPVKQRDGKEQAPVKQRDGTDALSLQDTLKASTNLGCSDQLMALALCGTPSR